MNLVSSVVTTSLCCLLIQGCASTRARANDQWASLPDEQALKITTIIDQTTSQFGVVGYSVAVLQNGELVYRTRGGFSNIELGVHTSADDRYQIYSATKLFFNVALMQLVEEGRLDADRSLGHYLPGVLPDEWGKITVRQAWSHMTGTPDILGNTESNQELTLSKIKREPLEFEPGTNTQYNQTNYLLLKFVFESIAGEPYQSYLTEHVLAPAGLADVPFGDLSLVAPDVVSHYEGTDSEAATLRRRSLDFPSFLYTSAGINITLEEFMRWFQMLLNGQFVTEETLNEHWTPVLRNDGTPSYRSNGWERLERNGVLRVGHGGGGRIHLFHFIRSVDTTDNVTIIYLDNGGAKVFDHREFSDRLAEVFIPGLLQ